MYHVSVANRRLAAAIVFVQLIIHVKKNIDTSFRRRRNIVYTITGTSIQRTSLAQAV